MFLLLVGPVRLTFNRPAAAASRGAEAVIPSVDSEGCYFTLASRNEAHAIALVGRERGGLELVLPADVGSAMVRALGVTATHPYALLSRDGSSDRFRLVRYEREGGPARHLAAARFWLPDLRRDDSADFDNIDPASPSPLSFIAAVRRADALVRQHSGHIGRPPKELAEARRIVSAFDDLVRELRPDLVRLDSSLVNDLRAARAAVDRGLERIGGAVHAMHED